MPSPSFGHVLTHPLLLLAAGFSASSRTAVGQEIPGSALGRSTTESWAGSFGMPYTLSKKVAGDGIVAPGRTVVYTTEVSGSGASVAELRDFPPPGFHLVNARVSIQRRAGDPTWQDFSPAVVVGEDCVAATGSGWDTSRESIIALETTYTVPDDAVIGTRLDSGAGTTLALASGNWNVNPMGVCVTIGPR
ncbi:MAG: hypothetical protein ACI9JD_002587 [Rhodococcus sp. (in: high G+C Gram-positive bacteria)]|jgi:hypothetical protein